MNQNGCETIKINLPWCVPPSFPFYGKKYQKGVSVFSLFCSQVQNRPYVTMPWTVI